MLKTKHVITTIPALTQSLANIDLQKIAIETGLIKRITSGFCAQGYLLGLLKTVASGDGSLRQLASSLGSSAHCTVKNKRLDSWGLMLQSCSQLNAIEKRKSTFRLGLESLLQILDRASRIPDPRASRSELADVIY